MSREYGDLIREKMCFELVPLGPSGPASNGAARQLPQGCNRQIRGCRKHVWPPLFPLPINPAICSNRSGSPLLLGFVLAARRPSSPLGCGYRCHPRRRSPAAFAMSYCKAFEYDDGFLDLCPLLAQITEHLQNIHFGSIAYPLLFFWSTRLPFLPPFPALPVVRAAQPFREKPATDRASMTSRGGPHQRDRVAPVKSARFAAGRFHKAGQWCRPEKQERKPTMTNAAHTPGPWICTRVYGPEADDVTFSVHQADNAPFPIAHDIQKEAKARLIAAVAQFLKVAERVVSRWEKGDLAEAVRELDAAISCAKGRAQ
jgi:hypothetical protein